MWWSQKQSFKLFRNVVSSPMIQVDDRHSRIEVLMSGQNQAHELTRVVSVKPSVAGETSMFCCIPKSAQAAIGLSVRSIRGWKATWAQPNPCRDILCASHRAEAGEA